MSLTISEGQRLSLRTFEEINRKDIAKGRRWTPFVIITDLLEEAGEVASTVKGVRRCFNSVFSSRYKNMTGLMIMLKSDIYVYFYGDVDG